MFTRKFRWAAALGLALGLRSAAAHGDEVIWRPVARPAAPAAEGRPQPAASLGRPVPLADSGPLPATPPSPPAPLPRGGGGGGSLAPLSPEAGEGGRGEGVTTTSYSPPPPPAEKGIVVRAQSPDVPAGGPPPVPPPTSAYQADPAIGAPIHQDPGFWTKTREFFSFGNNQGFLQCDHAFDVLASPVSNPFFFEDPRSLTEIRPIFIYQSAPKNNPLFNGGNAGFFGVQGRVALSQQWSIVLNELGLVWLDPKNGGDVISTGTGFAELRIGPKWTFCRDDNAGFVAATGLTFELPIGSNKEFQNTGNLGLDPYITVAKNFGRLPNSWGSFNVIGEAGYSFAVDSQRAEFLHGSVHLDYDVANLHRFYPLIELNWFHYTKGGKRTDLGFEGADLVNFGSSSVGNRDYVTFAAGLRYKWSEAIQFGGAVEFPISKEKGINDFRVTLDMIYRF